MSINPVVTGGGGNAGGYDDVAATVAGAVQNAQARYTGLEADMNVAGPAEYGAPVALPTVPGDSSKHTGPVG